VVFRIHLERSITLVIATSEIAANASFQDSRAKRARDDQSASQDSFAALVDSNVAADARNDRAQAAAVAQSRDSSTPPRRSDDNSTRSNDVGPRDESRADTTAANAAQDRDDAAAADAKSVQQQSDAAKDTQDAKDAQASKDAQSSKSDATKTDAKDGAKDTKAAGDTGNSKDAKADDTKKKSDADAAQPAANGVAAVIATAIPAPAVPTGIVPAPAADGTADGAPLAIAAAALKAHAATQKAAETSSETAAATATAASVDAAASGDKAATGDKTTSGETAASVETAAALQTAATAEKTATGEKKAVTDVAAQATDPDIAAAVAAAADTASKTPAKGARQTNGVVATAKTEKSGTADAAAKSATASAADGKDAAQPVAATDDTGKPKAASGDRAKSEAAGATPTPAASHDHKAAAAVDQSLPAPLDTTSSLPTSALLQPLQLQPVATAAISTAHLTATASGDAAVPLSGLAVEIASSALNGKSSFQIRLDPAELGRIDVRMDVDRHGQVTSHLTVERPETLAMLRQDAPQLQRALQDAGLKTSDSGLQFSLRDQSSSGQNQGDQSGRNSQRVIISEEDAIPAMAAQRSYGRMLGASGGVDIRI
jgi:flagellar hook-length control protein FliK